jgi:hypothetical protein
VSRCGGLAFAGAGVSRTYPGQDVYGALGFTTGTKPVVYQAAANQLSRYVMGSPLLTISTVHTFPDTATRTAPRVSGFSPPWNYITAADADWALYL